MDAFLKTSIQNASVAKNVSYTCRALYYQEWNTGEHSAKEGTIPPLATYSLEAKQLIWVWIMKVKGPKNQADVIEVLYVVGVTGPPKDENYTWFHWVP